MTDLSTNTPPPSSFGVAGRYAIRRELGRGMMGVVYEAEDTALGRRVALKTIELAFETGAQARDEFEQRFFIEARVAAKLSHPGIVVCHDVGKDPGSGKLFIVFEYLHGRTLAQRIAEGPIDWREALRIVARAARAIHHAHEHGVIHRDLKPANLMLLEPADQVKIMDFGVAKVESLVQLTVAGQTFGSPHYMSPEQALGQKSDARSDIFSLGSIVCTVLLNRPWFEAPNIPGILDHVIHQEAPRVSELVPELPETLDAIVARALAKQAEDRYPDASAMADDLEDVVAGRTPRHVHSGMGDALLDELLMAPAAIDKTPAHAGDVLTTLLDDAPASLPPPAKVPVRVGFAVKVALLIAALAGAGLFVLAGGFLLWQAPRPSTPPSRVVVTPIASPEPTAAPTEMSAETVPATLPPVRVRESDITPPAGITPEDVKPTIEPEPTVATPAPTSPPARSHLRLVVDHPLEHGRLVIWIDGVVAFETKLHAEVAKKFVVKVHKGHLEETLDVEPGRHEIKVEVSWKESRRVETQIADIADGTTGTLTVRLARVTNDLSLAYSSDGSAR